MDEEEIILKAKHLHTIFRNDTNGYTVAKFVTYDANEEKTNFISGIGKYENDLISLLDMNVVAAER